MVPEEGVKAFTEQTGWNVSTAEQRHAAKLAMGDGMQAGEVVQAAVEKAGRTATFGLTGPMGREERERQAAFQDEHPYIAMGAQAAGAFVPAAAAAALTGGAGTALGLSAGEAGLVAGAAEGLAGGAADETEQARYETRDVSAGNIFLYGLGGEIVGRALPHGLAMGAGKIKRALTAVEEAAGEGIPSALAGAEARSVESQARLARDLPPGSPERAAALRDSAAHQYDRMATEGANDLRDLTAATTKMGETNAKRVSERLRETMADPSPAQTEWFTGARERLNGAKGEMRAPMPVDAPAPTTMDDFLEGVAGKKAKAKAAEEVTDEVMERAQKLGVDPATGAAEWERIQREVLAEKAAQRTTTLADAPGARPLVKDFDKVIEDGLKKLDKTTDTAEQFLAAREVKQQLQALSDRVSKLKGPAAEQMKTSIDGAWQHVAEGLTDKSLFGAAADIEREISSPFRDKVAQSLGQVEQDLARGAGETGREFDPKRVRSFLKGDKVDRAVTQGHLERVLEGAEEQLAAHERHGTWDPHDIAKSRERIGRVRESLGLADEIRVARDEVIPAAAKTVTGSTASEAAAAATSAGESALRGLAESGLESIVNHVVPFGGTILKLGKRIAGIDGAARAATKQVARNLAGVGLGYAERMAGRVSRGAAGAGLATGAMTALARFTGDYSGPEESFEAKRKLLDDEQVSPDVLYDVLGHSLGDLPKVNRELFQAIAQRTAEKVRYMRENLPPGLQVSLLYPNGTPPSRSALRDFATQWNTVMDPESVLHDIDAGTATPLQMTTLKGSDPDLYDQLRGDVIEQVGTHFAQVPMSTKLQLDILFQADGLAGPLFSSAAADMIGEAMQAQKEMGQKAPMPPPSGGDAGQGAHGPSGLESIQTSVTNRGGT